MFFFQISKFIVFQLTKKKHAGKLEFSIDDLLTLYIQRKCFFFNEKL